MGMKLRNWLYFISFCVSIGLIGCSYDKGIWLNIEKQEIVSCNSGKIYLIYIRSETKNENYRIEWNDKDELPPSKICLLKVDPKYKIVKGWNNEIIVNSNFKLSSNTRYIISRELADVVGYEIFVTTNGNALIDSVSNNDCR